MTNKTCIIIAGPTAVGKTKVAIDVAKSFSSKIISADSRQCFRELNIGVAKPTQQELSEVQHYFIHTHSIHENINAAEFEQYALHAVDEIFKNNDVAVMVGGTGLYIKAFCEGLDEIPAVQDEIRTAVIRNYDQLGIGWLRNELLEKDPVFARQGEMHNPHRMMRALEVMLATGKSIISYKQNEKKHRPFSIIKIALDLPRQDLYSRINCRVDDMMQSGLEEEARGLEQFQSFNALQTVGYRELFEYFSGAITLNEAVEKIKLHTRHYAKRQITWFNKDPGFVWLPPDSAQVINHIKSRLRSE